MRIRNQGDFSLKVMMGWPGGRVCVLKPEIKTITLKKKLLNELNQIEENFSMKMNSISPTKSNIFVTILYNLVV